MTERDPRVPDGADGPAAADDLADAAETVDAADMTVAGDPVETDPDLADSTDADSGAMTPVGPGASNAAAETPATGPDSTTPRTVATSPTRRSVDRRAGRLPPQPASATPSEQAVHIDDRISKIFVAATVAIFVLIVLNGVLLGHGGLLARTPSPSPAPSVSASPSPSGSPGASGSPGSSASPAASGSPGASGAAASPSPS